MREARSWAVNSDKEFVFKIRALHCTPLEFRTGFLAGAFNLKVATIRSLPLHNKRTQPNSYRDPGDASIAWISAAFHLLILMSTHEVMDWLLSRFLVLKFPGCGSHISACHRQIESMAEISVPSEAANWRPKTDPQFAALCLNPRT